MPPKSKVRKSKVSKVSKKKAAPEQFKFDGLLASLSVACDLGPDPKFRKVGIEFSRELGASARLSLIAKINELIELETGATLQGSSDSYVLRYQSTSSLQTSGSTFGRCSG